MPLCNLKSTVLTAALALLAGTPLANAAQIVWTGVAGDNNWNTASNWNLGRVPNTGDDAVCNLPPTSGEIQVKNFAGCNSLVTSQRLVIAGGSLRVNTSASLNNGLLMYNPGGQYSVLDNRGSITVQGATSLFAGAIRQQPGAGIEFTSACSVTMFDPNAANGMSFEGGSITNNGSFEVRAPQFFMGNYYVNDGQTVFANGSSGNMRFIAATAVNDHSYVNNGVLIHGGSSIFINEGNVQFLAAGASRTRPDISVWNYGAGFIEVDSGTLTIDNTVNVDAGSMLNGASWYVHNSGVLSFGRTLYGIAANTNAYIFNAGSAISGLTTATDIRGSLFIDNGASVTIAQTVNGSLTNRGFISIGEGQLYTTGSYVQYPEGTLRRSVSNAGAMTNPAIISDNRPILGGTLIVDFYDTSVIQPGAGFPMVVGTCCTTGAFDTVTVNPVNGSSASMNYSNGQAVLRVPVACVGDFNNDLVVNTADLVIFLGRFGDFGDAGITGDLNYDGSVNTADLVTFLGRFGSSCL
jgi:hypothetical protein